MKTAKALVLAAVLAASIGMSASAETLYGAAAAREAANPTVEQMLTFAIQDEYLARAEYTLIMSKLNARQPFSNIKQAEEQHIAWLEGLFTDYKLPVPVDEARPGVPANLSAAYEAGVQAELDNIAMYKSFLARDLPEDVRAIFERLEASSRNHLQAFSRNLARAW